MKITVMPGVSGGEITAIPSKSFAHRLLILAAFADRETDIICGGTSEDIDATADCLSSLGAGIDRTENGYRVAPAGSALKHAELNCRESGSTYRFLLPVAAALGTETVFSLGGRLPMRPIGPLTEILAENGITVDRPEPSKLSISGRLSADRFRVRGDISSQFITGLMLAAAVMRRDISIGIEGGLASKGYVDITGECLRMFGIDCTIGGSLIEVKGGSGIVSPGTAEVEGDWSNSAFIAAMCLAGGKDIRLKGLNPASVQGDRRICCILEEFGCTVAAGKDTLDITADKLRPARVDAGDVPDLVPALAVLGCAAAGQTVIENVSRLRLKESDRIESVSSALRALGAEIESDDSSITVNGTGRLKGGCVDPRSDHRIVMMAAAASPLCSGPVVINDAEAVNKSYPGFFTDAGALGLEYLLED